jgi:hypothetical protein
MPRELPSILAVPLSAALALSSLAGCDRAPKHAAAEHDTAANTAVAAVEADLRAASPIPKDAQVRGVVAWNQAVGGRVAVCGQVAPYADDQSVFVPFVSVMTSGKVPTFERFVGTDPTEADRVYTALVDDCYAGGGPQPGPAPSAMSVAPLPNTAVTRPPTASTPHAGSAPDMTQAEPPPAPGTVTMRQDGNLHAVPRGPTLRVVVGGTVLHVFGTAAGGWYEVGSTAPEGWVHQSMLKLP